MPALQVKECPAAVYDKLRECASRENRSISQQALTIIEGYLGMREQSAGESRIAPSTDSVSVNHNNYLEKRQTALNLISSLKPIPTTRKCPNSAQLLKRSREEDAR